VGWPIVGCGAFREIDGLAGPAGREQPAEADFPDGERVEQDFLPRRGFQGMDTPPSDRVELVRLSGLSGSTGEQDQPCSLASGMIVDLQGLPEPDDPSGGMAGLAEFVAVHAQHEGEQLKITNIPGNTQRTAGPPGSGSQSLLRQQVPERDPEGDLSLGQ
jgi:hypothetical protein